MELNTDNTNQNQQPASNVATDQNLGVGSSPSSSQPVQKVIKISNTSAYLKFLAILVLLGLVVFAIVYYKSHDLPQFIVDIIQPMKSKSTTTTTVEQGPTQYTRTETSSESRSSSQTSSQVVTTAVTTISAVGNSSVSCLGEGQPVLDLTTGQALGSCCPGLVAKSSEVEENGISITDQGKPAVCSSQ